MEQNRKRQIRDINSELPSSIIETIFSKLHFLNLLSCRIVCKRWYDLISTCKFDSQIWICSFSLKNRWLPYDPVSDNLVCVELDPNPLKGMSTVASFNFHPTFSSDYKDFSIVNSCNGILCLLVKKFYDQIAKPHALCILNPITNEYLKLPSSEDGRNNEYNYGLGFSPKTKQYKLARASIPVEMFGTQIEILAFSTTTEWITVGYLDCFFNTADFVYFNGGLHLVKDYTDRVIYRLDVEDESIGEVPSPPDRGMFHHMIELDGSIYLTFFSDDDHVHLWMMTEDSSWIHVFDFSKPTPTSFMFQFFKVYEDGKILCRCDSEFILYDPMSNSNEIVTDQYAAYINMKTLHQIDSFNFNSLPKILAGNS